MKRFDFSPRNILLVRILFIILCTISLLPSTGGAFTKDKILFIAEPEFRQWLAGIPESKISDFGFTTNQELKKARLLTPIPSFFPDRELKEITKISIEEAISLEPQKWVVPVDVDGRIVCIIVVSIDAGEEPVVTEFGKTYAAKRLEAGYRLLGWQNDLISQVRLVSFFSPVYELIITKDAMGSWLWINLTGTTTTSASFMSLEDINNMLQTLNEDIRAPVLDSEKFE